MALSSDPTFWQWLTGGLATALGSMSLWVASVAHSSVKEKADAADVVTLAASVKVTADALASDVRGKADSHAVTAILSRLDLIISNSREDSKRFFDKIDETNRTHALFAQKVMEEMGKRPTREEWCMTRKTDN